MESPIKTTVLPSYFYHNKSQGQMQFCLFAALFYIKGRKMAATHTSTRILKLLLHRYNFFAHKLVQKTGSSVRTTVGCKVSSPLIKVDVDRGAYK